MLTTFLPTQLYIFSISLKNQSKPKTSKTKDIQTQRKKETKAHQKTPLSLFS